MRGEPNIAPTAALIGDPSRAAMLMALADGRALPAGELAEIAGLSLPGASAHLARLLQGGLVTVEREGRHRYYRLAGRQVAAALESLAVIPSEPLRARVRLPSSEALRRGRACYDHVAGEIGVTLAQALEERNLLAPGEGKRLVVTAEGERWFADVLGIETKGLRAGRHGVVRRCLDWTEGRNHVAGPLGAEMLRRFRELGWIVQAGESARAIELTPTGADGLRRALGTVRYPCVRVGPREVGAP